MELSKRLTAVTALVGNCEKMADVGTDHGYIPIHLLRSGICEYAIAMDVNAGPLQRAKDHIASYGLDNQIETRLSDGVRALHVGECETVVVAGMGGPLTIKILEEGEKVFRELKEFVLQPQSEIEKVRRYLHENTYNIVEEDMVLEDGKFYPMMRVVNAQAGPYSKAEFCFGKILLEKQHSVLKLFLERELYKKEKIKDSLDSMEGAHIEVRMAEIESELDCIKEALSVYQ